MNRGERERLPDRRTRTGSVHATVAGMTLHLHTAAFEDGRCGEIFIRTRRGDSAVRGLLNTLSITASLALQYGAPLEELVDAWKFQKFEPHGPVIGHDRLKMCSSLVDYVGRELAITYLGRDDLAHVDENGEAT